MNTTTQTANQTQTGATYATMTPARFTDLYDIVTPGTRTLKVRSVSQLMDSQNRISLDENPDAQCVIVNLYAVSKKEAEKAASAMEDGQIKVGTFENVTITVEERDPKFQIAQELLKGEEVKVVLEDYFSKSSEEMKLVVQDFTPVASKVSKNVDAASIFGSEFFQDNNDADDTDHDLNADMREELDEEEMN